MEATFLDEKGIVCEKCLGQQFAFDEMKGMVCVDCEKEDRFKHWQEIYRNNDFEDINTRFFEHKNTDCSEEEARPM